jgi:hypothetical protein
MIVREWWWCVCVCVPFGCVWWGESVSAQQTAEVRQYEPLGCSKYPSMAISKKKGCRFRVGYKRRGLLRRVGSHSVG